MHNFAGISLGQQLRNCKSIIQAYLYLIGKLTLICVVLWFATSLCENWFGVSHHLANIGYVTWILAFSVTMLVILMSVELLVLTLNVVVKANVKTSRTDISISPLVMFHLYIKHAYA
jgi:NADH:ubiquinone oxidoreductase subunit K